MPNIILPRPRSIQPPLGSIVNQVDDLADGLELCYLLNEQSGIRVNNCAVTGDKYNGLLQSNSFFRPVHDGNAVDIANVINSYIAVPVSNGAPFLKALTIFIRVNIRTGGTHRDLAAKGLVDGGTHSPFAFRADASSVLTLDRANNTTYREHAGPAVSYGAVHNYAVMCPNELIETPPIFYIDSKPTIGGVASGSATGPPTDLDSVMWFGRRPDGATQLDGLVECIYIWSKNLTQGQMDRLQENHYCFINAPSYRTFSYYSGIVGGITAGSKGSQIVVIG